MKPKTFHKMSGAERARRNACLNLLKCLLIFLQVCVFIAVWFRFYSMSIYKPYYYWGNWAVVGVFFVLYVVFTQLYGGFQVKTSRSSELFYSLFIGSVFPDVIIYFVICLLSYRIANPLPLLLSWGVGLLVSLTWTRLAVLVNDSLFPPKHTCVVYGNEDSYRVVANLQKLEWKFKFTSILRVSDNRDNLDEILEAVQNAEAVFICGLPSSVRNRILKLCIDQDIHAYIRPNIGDILVSGASRFHLANTPLLHCCRSRSSYWYRLVSRTIDIVFSGLALIAASPVMLVTALAIRSYDGGPALYKQVRLTENGRPFRILKFRSMRMDAEKDGVARLASENDDRITPVGHIIRKFRLDELPQLINILRGDMAIVGPRPERPEIAAQYEEEMPEFRLRLQVKAGLTGYAQVYGKYNTEPYDKLEMDLLYIANRSILQDLRLMFATVKILFQSESTEGVKDGQTTAAKEHISIN